MADGYCDWGDAPHPRNVIITTLTPPSTIELCDDHYAPGLIPLLAANLGVEPGALYDAIEKFMKREAARAAKAAADAQAAQQAKGSSDPAPPGAADVRAADDDGPGAVSAATPGSRPLGGR